jgi:allantoin racemase
MAQLKTMIVDMVIPPSIKILWVNPINSSVYDEPIAKEIAKIKLPNAEVHVMSLDLGPNVKLTNLEHRLFESKIWFPVTQIARFAAKNEFDAYAIGCFYDTAFHEARETSGNAVVRAPCEAALQVAVTLGNKFSVIIGHKKWEDQMTKLVEEYGHKKRLASFRDFNMHVPDFQKDHNATKKAILKACKAAKDEDGADVLVLGCTIEFGFAEELQEELGMPVVDVIQACYMKAELSALMKKKLGLKPSRLNGMAPPSEEEIEESGLFSEEEELPIGNHLVLRHE